MTRNLALNLNTSSNIILKAGVSHFPETGIWASCRTLILWSHTAMLIANKRATHTDYPNELKTILSVESAEQSRAWLSNWHLLNLIANNEALSSAVIYSNGTVITARPTARFTSAAWWDGSPNHLASPRALRYPNTSRSALSKLAYLAMLSTTLPVATYPCATTPFSLRCSSACVWASLASSSISKHAVSETNPTLRLIAVSIFSTDST
jgi:hypothetical protein